MTSALPLQDFNVQLPIIGTITAIVPNSDTAKEPNPDTSIEPNSKPDKPPVRLTVLTRSGSSFEVVSRANTWQRALRNLAGDGSLRQREGGELQIGDLVAVDGIYSRHDDLDVYDALVITVLVGSLGYYRFEHTFWWVEQIKVMAKRWLDNLFGDKAVYSVDDFSSYYRTALNIQGQPVEQEGDLQEMATLSRLIYGFSSAYQLTGEDRFLHAATAGVAYQREAFRSISADGRFCFWLHARKRNREGRVDIFASLFDEDQGTLPLYEQIYALAGLAQYYRISNDWEVLHDIQRTLETFDTFFADKPAGAAAGDLSQANGFFSHIDPVTFKWNDDSLNSDDTHKKKGQKNWNSLGDHLPAYLVNLILALDPLPQLDPDDPDSERFSQQLERLLGFCRSMLEMTAAKIADHFPEQDNPFVRERFDRDWQPIDNYGWQLNRAVVGHNLKIAWNLTRVAHYYRSKGQHEQAARMEAVAKRLGHDMARFGIDRIRSGVYDAVEREPQNGMAVQFSWLNTRDFWQQEQGILAYLILFGQELVTACSGDEPADPENRSLSSDAEEFLGLARELQAYWNLFFLDHARRGVFFRVSDNGQPVISDTYADKGGHSISGYHVFELAFLAQVYQRAYLPRQNRQHTGLSLHFAPAANSRLRSINVLPDLLGPGQLTISNVSVDGVERWNEDRDGPASGPLASGQVELLPQDLGRKLTVTLKQSQDYHQASKGWAVRDGRHF
jgi:mannose/cellobiose epimerase-like protein (N-acyl-D-glucosamine 2-epimerase family)